MSAVKYLTDESVPLIISLTFASYAASVSSVYDAEIFADDAGCVPAFLKVLSQTLITRVSLMPA